MHRLMARYEVLKARLADERGATAIEYALIAGLIAVGITATAILLRDQIIAVFNKIVTSLQ